MVYIKKEIYLSEKVTALDKKLLWMKKHLPLHMGQEILQ